MRADAAHCLDAEVEGCRIPPATVVHDEREPTASQALNHASLVPECGHILGALDDRHDLGNTKIGQCKKIRSFWFMVPLSCQPVAQSRTANSSAFLPSLASHLFQFQSVGLAGRHSAAETSRFAFP